MEVAVTGTVRLSQVETPSIYIPFVLLGWSALLVPVAVYIDTSYYIAAEACLLAFVALMFCERFRPGSILNFIVALPIYLMSVTVYFIVLLTVTVSGEMNGFYVFLAIVSGGGKIFADSIVVRKLTSASVVTSLVEGRRVTMSDRGLVVTIPWASDLFTEFSRWEATLIWSMRAILLVTWAWAFFRYAPVMYSSVGALERAPHMLALAGFPMAFFLAPLWQIPFMYYCHKHADQLVDAAEKQRLREDKAALKAKQEARENA